MAFTIFDHTVRRKVDLLPGGERRVCILSKTSGAPRGSLHDLRHFVLIDVLKNRLKLDGIQVDHLILGTPSAHESDLRALGIALPDGWVRPHALCRHRLDELLPGPAAREVITWAAASVPALDLGAAPPLSRRGAQDRLLLSINASAPRSYALETDSGRPWLRERDEEATGVVSELIDLDMVRSAGIGARQFRFHCLATHYRRPVSFSVSALRRSALAHRHLIARFAELETAQSDPLGERAVSIEERFREALADDANAARGLSIVAALLRESEVPRAERLELSSMMNAVLGLGFVDKSRDDSPGRDLREPISVVSSRAQHETLRHSIELRAGAHRVARSQASTTANP